MHVGSWVGLGGVGEWLVGVYYMVIFMPNTTTVNVEVEVVLFLRGDCGFCSAWPRLKLNTKIGLPTTHHTNS